jgi:diguanylate cyclase (GGDEF)-like protein
LFTLAVILPIGAATVASYSQVKKSLAEQAYQRLHSAGKFHGNTLISRLLYTQSLLLALSESQFTTASYSVSLITILKTQTDAITSVAASGDVAAVTSSVLADAYLLQEEEGPDTHSLNSTITRSSDNGDIFLSVLTRSGSRLVARMSREYLFGENVDRLLNNNFCIFEQLSTVYCTSSMYDNLAILESMSGEKGYSGRLSWTSNHTNYLASARDIFLPSRFNSAIWTLVAVEDEDTVYSAIQAFRWMFPAAVTLSVLCIFLFVISQTRRWLSPLSVLREGALQLGGGNFESRIVVDTNDEFEELADSFNGMAEKLGIQFRFLKAMAEIDEILLSSSNPSHMIEIVAQRLPQLITADMAAFFVCDVDYAEQGRLYSTQHGHLAEPIVCRADFNKEFLARISEEEHFTLEESEERPAFLDQLARGIGAVHLFPLHFEQRLLGCLCVADGNFPSLPKELLKQVHSVSDRLKVALTSVERQKRLYQQAHYDGLTGLPNRELFLDRLGQYLTLGMRNETNVAVIYLDLDRFKLVNDTLGHAQGDEVLKLAADRFRTVLRASDTLARLSGDEFVFALPDLNTAQGATKVVDVIVKQLAAPFCVMDQQFNLGASIGIALYPEDGLTAEELLKNADVAMYRAKDELSTPYLFYEKSMNEELQERTMLGQQLTLAIEAGQLQLVYQPKIETRTFTLHSVEALLRWHHPELGWVNPEKFIAIAEEIGLIEEIGVFVLNQACDQFAQWREAGLPISQIAVNVSPRQILYTDIVSSVRDVLNRTGLPGSCLELEITENLLISDYDVVEKKLFDLQQLGVGLALDDFGTGYSSLNHLHQLPFDTLKIDKTFVDALGTSDKADAIVISIIALAKSLNKTIVAEGIEQQEQCQFLVSRGCQLIQGYLYSKPVSGDDLRDLLANNTVFAPPNPVA